MDLKTQNTENEGNGIPAESSLNHFLMSSCKAPEGDKIYIGQLFFDSVNISIESAY